MAVQYTDHVIQTDIMWPAYCTAIGWSFVTQYGLYRLYVIILSITSIENAKCKIKNCDRSKPEILRLLWDIVIFRLVAYLLYIICLILQLLYKIGYMWIFVKTWHSFISISRLETGTSDRYLLYVSINSWDSQVSSYTPFHFSFTVPLQIQLYSSNWLNHTKQNNQ